VSEKKFKYIKNITETEATILLYDQIGDSVDPDGNYVFGISGATFAHEMQWLGSQVETINVRINSVGGSVLDGYSIVSAILSSKATVNTYIDGLAASIAGVIALAGKKLFMMDYGTLMLHNPSGTNDSKLLDVVKDTLVTIISGRTGKTAEDISAMMNVETWLSAKEAKELGMVDEIISSGKKIKIKKSESLFNMALIYNKHINKKMEKVTNILNLKNEATEQEIVQAIEVKDAESAALKAEKEALKAELDALKQSIKDAEEKAAEALKQKAVEMVENAVRLGKLTEAEKEATITNASRDEASFQFVANFISKIGNGKESKKPFDFSKVDNRKGGVDDRSGWSFTEWSRKDAKGLDNIRKENPELYLEMYNKEFKK